LVDSVVVVVVVEY